MVKYVKQSKKNLKVIIFSLNPFTEKEVINFISKLPANKSSVPNDSLVFIPKQSIHVYCLPYYERLFKKHNVS